MRYQYNGFIPQNIAPKVAKQIVVHNGKGEKVRTIALGSLNRPTGEKLYSYGLLSDLHCAGNNSAEGTRLDNALTFFENQGCSFCCHSGDMTNIGFWYPPADAPSANIDPNVIYLKQMEEYNTVRGKHPNLPLYGVCGNHESYVNPITENLPELKIYTGLDLYYTISHYNDVFIFIGQNKGNRPMSDEALQWLYETLELNRNKRCFVFVHPYVDNADSGNPYGVYGNNFFASWGTKKTAFINLLSHYKNTILFHGHSHMHFSMQEEISNSNYSEVLGFRSIHVPSISWNRKIVDGASVNVGGCYGYIVDVYENCVVLNGLDLLTNEAVPIAQYCIDTTLQTIEASTFEDDTGAISYLPSGYTIIDHIEVTGEQYINTGFVPNQDTRIVCEFKYLGGTGVYGARGSVSSNNFSLRVINGAWQMGYGDGVATGTILADDEWHTADQDKNTLYIDGVLAVTREYEEFTSPHPIAIGAIRASSLYYGEGCYRNCKIYDNGTLVRDFVPCTNESGEVGMYDFITNAFFINT